MPELPEVETIRQALKMGGRGAAPIIGQEVRESSLVWERTLAEPSPAEFHERITGQEIVDIDRRGKFLLLRLSPDTLIVHLRMSGDLNVVPSSEPVAEHDRLWLDLDDNRRLAFNDTRKFGRVWLVADTTSITGHLGPEPLDDGFTPEAFYANLHAHRRQIKPLLLDQNFLAGMGNIYTDEALHLARLHPLQLSNSLDESQSKRLWESIRQVLQEGIERQGASIDWVYKGGDFQNYFRVYQRTGSPCPECGNPIQRITVGQRGTHYCQYCQPEPT